MMPREFRVGSSHNLAPYGDLDDGLAVSVGQTISATLDYPLDFDFFLIELEEGDTIEITVDSLNVDPLLTVDFPGATDAEVFQDDDSGGGLFGTNARLTYRAAHTYTHLIVVQDAIGAHVGGYFLTISEAPPDAVAVSPPPTREVTTVDSPFRLMGVYEGAQYPFSIQYPADWVEQPAQLDVTASFAADQNTTFSIAEEDLVALELGEGAVHDFVDLIIDIFAALDIERN